MYLLVGLGNYGLKYERTRHNVGFIFLDDIAAMAGNGLYTQKFHSLFQKITWQNEELVLIKPQTYMNLSGSAVQEALAFFKISPEQIIVVCDDLDQEVAAVKMRFGGGHGGHNGLRDIIAKLGTDKFYRIKVGIGKPIYKTSTADYVLSPFTAEEAQKITASFSQIHERMTAIFKEQKSRK